MPRDHDLRPHEETLLHGSGAGEHTDGQTAATASGVESPQHPAIGPVPAACPFQNAEAQPRRLKALLWGDAGAGKTTLALQFPAPAVIDLEGGTDLYGDSFQFHVLRTTGPDDVMRGVQWLGSNQHPFKTLVIDPITIYWDALQKKWSDIFLLRNRGSKGHRHEFYDFQPRDWMTIKAEFKELVRSLIALDMNVIVTARAKAQYADGAFMRVIGETFDGEKSLPYLFDTIVRMFRDDKGRFMGECLKDRSNRLPSGQFECSYSIIEGLLDRSVLERPAQPVQMAGSDLRAEIRKLIAHLGIAPDLVSARLRTYGVETIDDLSEQDARLILDKLRTANTTSPRKENQS